MSGTADPSPGSALLCAEDGGGCWTWGGVRLSADGSLKATQRFADLSWDERRKRLAHEESSWLAAQCSPADGSRFEVRFATNAEAARVRAAFLVRACAATAGEARRVVGERLRRAAGEGGALPPHVVGQPIDSEAELRAWLGYPRSAGHFVEVRKHLSVNPIRRGGTGLRYAARHGFFDSGAAWDAWWRSFAALPFEAVLSIGFEPYDAGDHTFRRLLEQRAADLEELARPGAPSPLNPYRVPAEPAAQTAVPSYRRALARYAGYCFRIRVALVSAQPAPVGLVESLVRTVSSMPGGAQAVPVASAEFDRVVAEFRALGAPTWLPVTYQRGYSPDLGDLGGLDQLLHSLADVAEAGAALTLPVHWPSMPPVFLDSSLLPPE